MAHQADIIPWHILASKLRWAPGRVPSEIHALGLPSLPGKLKDCEGCECGVTNLHPISICPEDPDEDEFAKAFAQVVKDASKHKRAQYPENYSPPSPEDIILDDEIIQKIGPHASTWSDEMHDWSTIPSEQRVISAFQNTWINEDCHSFWERNETAFVNLEIVKTLLMFGDLDPILRACADPSVKLANWYSAAICSCAVSHNAC